jgi:hypothetical protein
MHDPNYWADLASRDIPWLVGEVEQLREALLRPQPQGTYTVTLSRAGAAGSPLIQFHVPVGQSFQWEADMPFVQLQPVLLLKWSGS